jgi:hypothetical protein
MDLRRIQPSPVCFIEIVFAPTANNAQPPGIRQQNATSVQKKNERTFASGTRVNPVYFQD